MKFRISTTILLGAILAWGGWVLQAQDPNSDPAAPNPEPQAEENAESPEALQAEMGKLYQERDAINKKIKEIQTKLAKGEVTDHALKDVDGNELKLSSLFGDHSDLIMIHNMGAGCPYCTLWGDSLIGLQKHIESQAALVIASPDEPAEMKKFAEGRGWNFTMVSDKGTELRTECGFESAQGIGPGYSVFHKDEDGTIRQVGSDWFGPGDLYCGIWHMLARTQGGVGEWGPKFSYEKK